MMAPHTVFQILYLICAPGTQPDDCTTNSQLVVSKINGPTCGSSDECSTMAYQFLGSLYAQGDPRVMGADKVIKVIPNAIGRGTFPPAEYGKIGEPEFKKLD